MWEFFRGWRRKVGVLTLMMTCIFAAGWVRSFFTIDEFVTEEYRVTNAIVSAPYGIRFETRYFLDGYFPQLGYSSQARFTIPYLSRVGGLTLLSAYLMLSKPRQARKAETLPNTAN